MGFFSTAADVFIAWFDFKESEIEDENKRLACENEFLRRHGRPLHDNEIVFRGCITYDVYTFRDKYKYLCFWKHGLYSNDLTIWYSNNVSTIIHVDQDPHYTSWRLKRDDLSLKDEDECDRVIEHLKTHFGTEISFLVGGK